MTINFGLRCGQLMAERADPKRMNFIERDRLWYRLERIGQVPDAQETEQPQETEWSKRQWDYVQQLHGLVLNLQGKLNEHIDAPKKTKGTQKPKGAIRI